MARYKEVVVPTKHDAQGLVRDTQRLLRGGQSLPFERLQVIVPCDPTPEDEPIENDWMLEEDDGYEYVDPRDFEPTDGKHDGLRAYRMLKPLLQLSELPALHIILREDYDYGNLFGQGAGHDAAGIPFIAAVISKLKSLVYKSSRSPQFKVSLQVMMGRKVHENDDISWLWDELSEVQVAVLDQFHKLSSEAEALQRQIRARTYKTGNVPDSEPANQQLLQEELEALEARSKEIYAQMNDCRQDRYVNERYRVRSLAMDPHWEERVEALAREKSEDDH